MLSCPVPILGFIQELRDLGDSLDLALICATQEHGNRVFFLWITDVLWRVSMVCGLYGGWQQSLLALDLGLGCLICFIIQLSIGQKWLHQGIVWLLSLVGVILDTASRLLQLECFSPIINGSEPFIPAIGQMLLRLFVVLISRATRRLTIDFFGILGCVAQCFQLEWWQLCVFTSPFISCVNEMRLVPVMLVLDGV